MRGSFSAIGLQFVLSSVCSVGLSQALPTPRTTSGPSQFQSPPKPQATVQTPKKILTFKQALEFALENSPRIDSVKKMQVLKNLEHKNTVSKTLPSLDLTTVNGLQNYIPMSGTNNITNPTAPWT